MSGLEVFGAVAAAATLLELARKCHSRLERNENVHRDIKALQQRVGVLTDTVTQVSNVLSDIRSQHDGQPQVTEAEKVIWYRMDAVLKLCHDKLAELDDRLDQILSKGSRTKLSVVPSDIARRTRDLKNYVQALNMLKDLFQL